MPNVEYWRVLVAANVITRDNDTKIIDAIAEMCFNAQEAGENCSVWHNAAKYYNTRCRCAQCEPVLHR